MITITALDLSNPKKPVAIINDTGAAGSGQRVPLLQLFAAMSDYRFAYVAPNAVIPEISKQQGRRIELEDYIRHWYQSTESTLKSSLETTSGRLLATIRNPTLLKTIDAEYPNINLAEKAKEYLAKEARNQAVMFQRFNIPPGSIENLYNNADVLEFTKWTVNNAIEKNISWLHANVSTSGKTVQSRKNYRNFSRVLSTDLAMPHSIILGIRSTEMTPLSMRS